MVILMLRGGSRRGSVHVNVNIMPMSVTLTGFIITKIGIGLSIMWGLGCVRYICGTRVNKPPCTERHVVYVQ